MRKLKSSGGGGMMKVYCKNCIHNWSNEINHDYCLFGNWSAYSGTRTILGETRSKKKYNLNGDCEDYKKIRWKFWAAH